MTKHTAFAAEDAVVAAPAPAQPGRRFTSYPPSSCRTAAAQRMDAGAAGAAARATGSWLDAVPRRAEHDDWMVGVHPRARAHYAVSLSSISFHVPRRAGARGLPDRLSPMCPQEKHPSALAGFESVLAAAKGKQVVMFLDYDGTLSPIVKDPDTAVMTEEVSAY
jgi:trehalose 6-phosphate phosphatase